MYPVVGSTSLGSPEEVKALAAATERKGLAKRRLHDTSINNKQGVTLDLQSTNTKTHRTLCG